MKSSPSQLSNLLDWVLFERDEPGCAPGESRVVPRSTIRQGMPVKVHELVSRLEADGWYQVRQKGSHRQFHHPTKPGTVTVAGKASVDVPRGTLNSVLKQAGLKQ